METTRLSPKGQIVIPHRIRERFGWDPGIEFVIETTDDGIALRPLRESAPTSLDEVYGCLGYKGPRKSLRDMEEGICRGARKQP